MNYTRKKTTKPAYYLTMQVAGAVLVLLGLAGMLSFIDFFLELARISKEYIPMAPDTGLIFLIYGVLLIIERTGKPQGSIRIALIWLTGLISIYGILICIQYFIHIDLTLENLFFPTHNTLNQFPLFRMSPITGALFFLTGIAYHFSHSSKPGRKKLQMVNMIGFMVANVGTVALLGYLFGSPFLYSGHVIPMAATTSFSFMALGVGLIAFADKESFITKLFNRRTARGRFMRVILPIVIAVILIQGLVEVKLDQSGIMDHAILSALLALAYSIIIPLIIIRLTKILFRNNERIEQEQKETREILLHERYRIRTLIDNLPDRIFFKDRSSRFIVANKSIAIHTGLSSAKDIVGKTDFDLYKPELAEQYFKDEQDLMMRGEPLLNHEERSNDSSGNIGWTITNKIPIRNKAGQVVGLVGVSRDITELKKVHEDLVAAKETAEQASKLKDYFIANLSHEIRTPLNAIIGFSEILKEEVELVIPEISEKYFPIIDISSRRLIRTIDLMLNLSRLQLGLYVTSPSRLDPDLIIRNLVEEYKPDAKQKNLELTYENTIGPAILETDEYCVVQSISNLLDNAVKYTNHGYVALKLYQGEPGSIKLDVQDTGIGIKEEYRKKLFEPFSQEDNSFTRQFEGIGLGLSITKKMLDAIGARIWVASTKEVGTTFTIEFPTDPLKS